MGELMNEFHEATFFTSLDFRSGFHHMRMKEEDEAKTTFQTYQGYYEYKVMPYGLTGGSSYLPGHYE
jgi:hypothetical protein